MKRFTSKNATALNTAKNTMAEAVMSTREIAKETNKRHADVIRDLKIVCKDNNWGISKFAHTYVNPQNKQTYTEYLLPRFEFEVLITGYDSKRRAAVIKRWYELESGKAEPHYKIQQTQKAQISLSRLANLDVDALGKLAPTYRQMMELGKEFCHNINQQQAFANQATANLTGINCLELGIPEIMSAPQALPKAEIKPQYQLDQEPVKRKSSSRKSHTKRTLREKNKYNLEDFFSIRELGEQMGTSTEYVRKVLLQNRIIKYIKPYANHGKYVLTDKGFKIGMMYDPTSETFHDSSSKRINTSNAQPVFGYDVLRFF